MKKTNPTIKEELTIYERADIVETIASVFFQVDDEGVEKYTPYLEEYGQIVAIAKFMVNGLEFQEGEDIYEAVKSDKELYEMILAEIGFIERSIMSDVYDIVSYKKQMNIAQVQNEANMYVAFKMAELADKEIERNEKELETYDNLNAWIDEQRAMSSMISQEDYENFIKNFDANAIINSAISKYGESDLHKKNRELIETSRKLRKSENKIIEMQATIAKEQQKESAKNVVADKPKKTRKPRTKTTEEKAE